MYVRIMISSDGIEWKEKFSTSMQRNTALVYDDLCGMQTSICLREDYCSVSGYGSHAISHESLSSTGAKVAKNNTGNKRKIVPIDSLLNNS